MNKILITLILLTLLSNTAIHAQSNKKIEAKLEKLYSKGKYDKCQTKANKYKSKQPKAVSPYYYLCKIEILHYTNSTDTPNKKQYKHLKTAANYTKRFKGNYTELSALVKQHFIDYLYSWEDNDYSNTHVKKATFAYVKTFKDTIPSYYMYYPQTKDRVQNTVVHKIPKTDSLRTELIKFASKLVGIPYKYTGEKPETGFDCSGFVLYVYKHIGIELPHNAHLQSKLEGETLTLNEAKPGDLIFFGSKNNKGWNTQHAGIFYANDEGETKVIHCVSRGVTIDGNNSSWDAYWKDRVLFVKRLPQLE